ncbi:ribonuclease P protein component [Marinitenerispora sediminis]|uniref:Ribonuclease P protein component n=1 Tax=Marinitenerispora sediminis TaxID=1931232 RepID=A0A368T5T8_9ACTN|nr:ribonuclease P protein component [Marinitenerispora sediminis]RCV55129.1 ribonuclease P protein component [Marinitenerispora sediminis]RCV55461.1 ribonuclease P protein component [Marinitenerispora sediminis]RCV61757.1 ribonuclease P protein component [Marinitenerispora sediminis]
MLSPQHRMRQSAEFALVLRRGRRAGRDGLVVGYLPPAAAATAEPRVGFVVSKAVGGAVVRKRVQRRLRHLMRERVRRLPPGSLLVVRAKPSSADAAHTTLAAQLDSALESVLSPRGGGGRRRRDRERATSGRASDGAGGSGAAEPAPTGARRDPGERATP